MVEEMDGPVRQLVRRRGRLQETGFDIPTSFLLGTNTDRDVGLRADDLIPEENDTVQLALKRLSPKESYDRVFRLRRAFQV